MIDVHLHLQDPRILAEVEAIVATCRGEGITRWILNGTHPKDWPVVAELTERFPEIQESKAP